MANISVKKIRLYPVGDKEEVKRVYTYIRNGQEIQSLMLNQCITAMYVARVNKVSTEEWKELKRRYSRVPSSTKGSGSAYDYDMSKYPTGLPLAGSIPRTAEAKLKKSIKDGLLYGNVSLPTFKKTMPLMVHNKYIAPIGSKGQKTGLCHDYASPGALSEALQKAIAPDIHIRFANGIVFNLILGNPHRSAELRVTLERIFGGEYSVCDSQIGIDDDKHIVLLMTVSMPEKEKEKETLDENTVCGVKLGFTSSCICALNNSPYQRELIGSYDSFTSRRARMQKERRAAQIAAKEAGGGHGRKKKLHHLDQLAVREKNFANTYNHMISKRVVEFAVANKARYINLENMKGYRKKDTDTFVLRNWSYYQLQTMIAYKAAAEGIEVRYVNPKNMSHICSICGGEGIVNKDRLFICSDPDCKSHTMYKTFNTDFNAARNVAQCQTFIGKDTEDSESTGKKKQERSES